MKKNLKLHNDLKGFKDSNISTPSGFILLERNNHKIFIKEADLDKPLRAKPVREEIFMKDKVDDKIEKI